MVNAVDSKSAAVRLVSSSLTSGTKKMLYLSLVKIDEVRGVGKATKEAYE